MQLLRTSYTYLHGLGRNVITADSLITHNIGSTQTALSTLDFLSVMKASQAISGELLLEALLKKLINIVIENAGAQAGYLLLETDGQWYIEAAGRVDQAEILILQSIPVGELHQHIRKEAPLPSTVINYVTRTKKSLVLADAAHSTLYEGAFVRDPYIVARQSKSILCIPLLNQGELGGIIYLENNLTIGAFNKSQVEVLNLLCAQAAISIKAARFHKDIRDNETRYRRLFEDSMDTIYIADSQHKIITINPAGLAMFGYARSEIGQMTIRDLYTAQAEFEEFQKTLTKQGEVKDFEACLQKKDGTKIDCLITTVAHQDLPNQISGYQYIVRDVSQRKQVQRMLAKYSNRLEQEIDNHTAQLKARVKELATLNTITQTAVQAQTLPNKLQEVTHQLAQIFNAASSYHWHIRAR